MKTIHKVCSTILIVVLCALSFGIYKKCSWSTTEDVMFGKLSLTASYLLFAYTAVGEDADLNASLRLNHIQVVGTHNSYHREISLAERTAFEKYMPKPENYYYSHSNLANQLSYQGVRSLELDLHPDDEGGLYNPPLLWKLANLTNATTPFDGAVLDPSGLKVFHVTDLDPDSVCHTFVQCLTELKVWSDAHPSHIPIIIDLELKSDAPACSIGGICPTDGSLNWTLPRILSVEDEIQSVIPREKLLTPDDVRKGNLTLEQSVLELGWPSLFSSRGKFMFFFDNDPNPSNPSDIRSLYTSSGHESLQNRTVFTNAVEGEPDAAVLKRNEPRGAENLAEVQRLVKKGYLIRTRANVPLETVLARDGTMRENAWESGAQIVSTDYPAWGMAARWGWDYVVEVDGGRVTRCNLVARPNGCGGEIAD
ncbi:unnamed protein product [Periconia digitata]|uniref:Uncharacterized protein n=1 Tax=Periconia digitata TaxID=1303443 RepID=A0A9W4UL45_9PLEO|nr:unnamed protein product [Periconia digitata]